MRVLLLGSNGAIGRRYAAILKHEKVDFIPVDNPSGVDIGNYVFDKVLIATPTKTHKEYCLQAIRHKKPFLCEKPIAETEEDARYIQQAASNIGVQGNIVCNWKVAVERLVRNVYPPYRITYDYYNTGNEDLKWNMAQLIYLDAWVRIYTESPRWNVQVNGQDMRYRQIEHSYVLMIKDWLTDQYQNLWNLEDGVKMVVACTNWDKRHGKSKR